MSDSYAFYQCFHCNSCCRSDQKVTKQWPSVDPAWSMHRSWTSVYLNQYIGSLETILQEHHGELHTNTFTLTLTLTLTLSRQMSGPSADGTGLAQNTFNIVYNSVDSVFCVVCLTMLWSKHKRRHELLPIQVLRRCAIIEVVHNLMPVPVRLSMPQLTLARYSFSHCIHKLRYLCTILNLILSGLLPHQKHDQTLLMPVKLDRNTSPSLV